MYFRLNHFLYQNENVYNILYFFLPCCLPVLLSSYAVIFLPVVFLSCCLYTLLSFCPTFFMSCCLLVLIHAICPMSCHVPYLPILLFCSVVFLSCCLSVLLSFCPVVCVFCCLHCQYYHFHYFVLII